MAATRRVGEGHRGRHRQTVRPHGGQGRVPSPVGAEIGLVGQGDPGIGQRPVGPAGQHGRRRHRGECRRLHVVVAGRGLDQREADPVVPPRPFVEELVLHRHAEHLLPDQRPGHRIGLAEEVVVTVTPPTDLGEPQRLPVEERLELTHLGLHAVLFVGVVGARVGMDAGHVHPGQPTGGDELLPPTGDRLQRGASDDGRVRLHRLHRGVEGLQHRSGVIPTVGPSGVVRLVPRFPRRDGVTVAATRGHRGVVGHQCGHVALPEAARHQGHGHRVAATHLDPVGHVVLGRQVRRLVRVRRQRREVHRRRSAGGRRGCVRVAVGEHRTPVDRGQAPMAAQAELGVEGDATWVGRAPRADTGRQGAEVEPVTGRPHGVGHAGRAEGRGWRGGRVEEGGLDLVGARSRVGRGQRQGHRGQAGGRCRKGHRLRGRHPLVGQGGGVLHRVGQLQVGRQRHPPRIEGRGDRGGGARGEVVTGHRRGEPGTPTQHVHRGLGCGQIGLQVGQGERRDGIARRGEGRAALEVEGRPHQREVPASEGELASEFGGGLEESGGRRRLDRVERIRGVDRPVGALDGLGRVVELGARSGVDVVALDVGRPEGRQHRARRTHRLDVTVGRVQQVPVRFLGHEPVVDEREAAVDRAAGRVEDDAGLAVLRQADDHPERRAGPHREDTRGVVAVGVDRPQQRTRWRELVDQLPVVGGQVDVARRVDDRCAGVALGEQVRQGERARLHTGERVGDQAGTRVHVEAGGGGGEIDHATRGRGHRRHGRCRQGHRRAEARRGIGGGAHRAHLGRRRRRGATRDLRPAGRPRTGPHGYEERRDDEHRGHSHGDEGSPGRQPARFPVVLHTCAHRAYSMARIANTRENPR